MTITLLLAALTVGLLSAPFWTPPGAWLLVPILLSLAGFLPRLEKLRPLLLLLALTTSAPVLYWDALTPTETPRDFRTRADQEFHILSGELVRQHQGPDHRSRLDLRNLSDHSATGTTPLTGRLRLTVDQLERQFLPGDRLQFRVRVKLPRAFGTPGEFDYPRHLASHGIFATGHLEHGRDLAHLTDLDEIGLMRSIYHFRQETGRWLQAQMPQEQGLLITALVLGDRDAFPEELRDRISRAGLAHLLAISGLHLGLLGWFLYQLGLLLYRRSTRLLNWQPPARILPLLLVPFLGGYTLLTGAALSTSRAFFMFSLAALLLLRGERQRPLDLLQLVLLLLLLSNPLTLWDPGLQLSAAGVAGILLLVPRWQKSLPANRPWLKRTLEIPLATFAASLATAPLVAFHFHQLIPAGLVSNLVAIPLIGFGALPLGLTGCLAHALNLPGAELPVQWAGQLINLALGFGEFVAGFDLLAPRPWFPDLRQLGAAWLVVLSVLLASRRNWRCAATVSFATLLLLLMPHAREGLTITALSVGQGESLLVELPDGRNFLIDGGGLRSPTFDVGERLLAPALGRLGVHQLDGILLTHNHPDHYRGLAFILANLPVKRFFSATPEKDLPDEIRAARQALTNVTQLTPGWQTIDAGSQTPLQVWVPAQSGKKLNDRSLAIYLGYGREGVLLTGDLEAEGVRQLSASLPDWPVSLLKLPHHGSRHSDPERLLDRLQPRFALVSAGFGNSYGLPSRQVIAACDNRHIGLLRTDLQGSISMTTQGDGWQAESHLTARLFH